MKFRPHSHGHVVPQAVNVCGNCGALKDFRNEGAIGVLDEVLDELKRRGKS